jgi:hypothetical protein
MSTSLKYNPDTGKIEEEVNGILVRTLDDPITNYVDYVPATDNERDIGSSSAAYKDMYIKGNLIGQKQKITFNMIGTAGEQAWVQVPYDCTITGYELTADQSGSIVIDLWVDTYGNFPPTVADTITASAKPTLSSSQKATDSTLTGWTKTLTAGKYILANVDSASTLEKATLIINVTRT